MKKRFLTMAIGAMSLFALAACSNQSQDIATMKGGKVTVEDFYDEAKSQQANQQLVQNMIIYKVFEENYGKKVTEKEINAKFDETKKQYGDNFDQVLKQSGLSEKLLKDQIKQGLAFETGLKSHIKLTDEDLKTAWKSFHPEVEAQLIMTATEDDANAALKEINDDKKDFGAVAKEKSVDTSKDKEGKVKFDSQDQKIPAQVKQAAFELKDGEVSKVIPVQGQYGNTFYIVKMVKNQAKGNSMDPYKKQLEEIATQTKMSDQTFVNGVIKEELTKANVKIKDDAFKNVLAQYIQEDKKEDTKDSSKKEEKTSTSSTKEEKSSSSKEEEKTSESTEAK